MEMQIVDKNCWSKYSMTASSMSNDPHCQTFETQEYASLKNLSGKDWNNDIESVIVGSSASVLAYKDKDFKGPEIAFAPGQRVPDLGKLDMSNEIESMKITCGK